jgi:hypothetical protein
MVVLSNQSKQKGVVCADAVRFGGGMGNIARNGQTSGLPRYLEGARYYAQWAGMPDEVYSPSEGKNDYTDDINARSHMTNYLNGGSVYNPTDKGLGVPIEMTLGFHSDAGVSREDEVIGSLGVVTTAHEKGILPVGISRYVSRDFISHLLNTVQRDISEAYGFRWSCRGILDKNYSESRIPYVPSMIFESLSHQNFMDMVYAHDPDFKFTFARALYKSYLKHLSYVHDGEYVVQPLPVSSLSLTVSEDDKSVRLRWVPVDDPQEPTAKPDRFVVYTRVNDGGYDNGTVVDKTYCNIKIEKGNIYGK